MYIYIFIYVLLCVRCSPMVWSRLRVPCHAGAAQSARGILEADDLLLLFQVPDLVGNLFENTSKSCFESSS